MADAISIDADVDELLEALHQLGEAAEPLVNEAARETAGAIDLEASARLRRQLGPKATGKTVDSIIHEPAYDGNGFIVAVERDPYPELPYWLEKGTRRGDRPNRATTAPRPYFWVSAELEEGAHFRRVEEAVQEAIEASGMGE